LWTIGYDEGVGGVDTSTISFRFPLQLDLADQHHLLSRRLVIEFVICDFRAGLSLCEDQVLTAPYGSGQKSKTRERGTSGRVSLARKARYSQQPVCPAYLLGNYGRELILQTVPLLFSSSGPPLPGRNAS
jgi:hypothetical protein